MRSLLPKNLNPYRFEKEFDDLYADDYKNRFVVSYKGHDFLIDNRAPFTINISEGINGEDVEERGAIIKLLRLAQKIRSATGQWPRLETEWEEMCPGGLIKLDVTPLVAANTVSSSLPLLLDTVCAALEKWSRSDDSSFANAETQYRDTLKGIAAFNETIHAMQRSFDEKPICILNVNTKARRLRYIVTLASFADTPQSAKLLGQKLAEWAEVHAEALRTHRDSKGAIKNRNGFQSVLPYLDLAKQLSVLAFVGRGLTLTNIGRVLTMIQSADDTFSLTKEERLYFLYDLLSNDRDLICPLLLQLSTSCPQRKRDVRQIFPEVYKEHLTRQRQHSGTVRSRRQIGVALERVGTWRRAEKYMEHVVDPRVSWLVDLELCSIEDDRVSLTDAGRAFAGWIKEFGESGIIGITDDLLKRRFFKVIAPIVEGRDGSKNRNKVEAIEEEALIGHLRRICEFVKMRTTSLVPNRIIASTLFRYAGIALFTQSRIAADLSALVAFFSDEEKAAKIGWRLRWLPARNDGYLTPVADKVH